VHVYAISVMVPWFDSIAYNAVMCSLPRFYGNEGMQPNTAKGFTRVRVRVRVKDRPVSSTARQAAKEMQSISQSHSLSLSMDPKDQVKDPTNV
jgi:hypothetical protein